MIEQRPWGTYEVLLDAPNCKVKRITVNARQRLSLQRHSKRSEYWTCISGEGLVTLGQSLTDLKKIGFGPGGHIYIPIHSIHRVEASPYQNLVFIEVQQGIYFGEDDIERFEDDYGRT